jgi:hypothetical protein
MATTVMVVVFPVIAYFAIRHWDIAEPMTWIFPVGVGVGVLLVRLLFGKQLKVDLPEARERRAQRVLRKAGLDVEIIRKVTTKYLEPGAEVAVPRYQDPL